MPEWYFLPFYAILRAVPDKLGGVILMFGAVLSITGAFGFGGVVTALCGFPSVDYAAHTITHHLDDYGGARFETGYASAISMVLFIIQVGANKLIVKLLSKVGN